MPMTLHGHVRWTMMPCLYTVMRWGRTMGNRGLGIGNRVRLALFTRFAQWR